MKALALLTTLALLIWWRRHSRELPLGDEFPETGVEDPRLAQHRAVVSHFLSNQPGWSETTKEAIQDLEEGRAKPLALRDEETRR